MRSDIRNWHKSFSATPRKADRLLLALSKIFSYAISEEHKDVHRNPCKGIPRLYVGSRKDYVWGDTEIETFRNGAQRQLIPPFEIALGTAQRQGDVLSLRWTQYDGTYLRFEQSKTIRKGRAGTRLKVPVHSGLKELLDSLPRNGDFICLNSRFRRWTTDGFKSTWGRELDRLGIKGLTFHDLRGTFITRRAREGATAAQIANISGHSLKEVESVLERYYLASDQEASDAVIRKMERIQTERRSSDDVNGV